MQYVLIGIKGKEGKSPQFEECIGKPCSIVAEVGRTGLFQFDGGGFLITTTIQDKISKYGLVRVETRNTIYTFEENVGRTINGVYFPPVPTKEAVSA